MPKGCLDSLGKWREFHWALLPELEGTDFCSRVLLPWGKGVWQRALDPSACSYAASFLASPREEHPESPATYCARWSPPPKRLRFVPHAACVCHMSQESRERKPCTPKELKLLKKKKSRQNSYVSNQGNCCIFSRDFFFLPVVIGGFSAGKI